MSIEVTIDGTQRLVNTVSHNIDGVWRESYNRNKYTVKLYRYGVLYRTLTCNAGSTVTLINVPTVEHDDIEHYGWTETAGNATRDYSPTQTITPTKNMELHAVYSWKQTVVGSKTVSCSTNVSGGSATASATVTVAGSVTISGSNTVSTPNGTANGTITLGSNSSSGDYVQIGSTFVTGTIGNGNTVTATVSANQTIYIKTTNTSDTYTSQIHSITVTYPAYVDKTNYRSSLGNYIVRLYNYNTLYATIEVPMGGYTKLPSISSVSEDDIAHVGWSTNLFDNSSTLQTVSNLYKPTKDIDLYAVFKYNSAEPESATASGTVNSSTDTINISVSDAVAGTSWSASSYISTPQQGKTTSTNYTTYYITYTTNTIATQSGTAGSSGVISVSFPYGFTPAEVGILLSGTSSQTSSPTASTYHTSKGATLNYYRNKTIIKYRTQK